jgi:hypothetical protein
MLNTKQFDGKEEVKVSKYLTSIGKYQLRINSVEAKVSKAGDSADFIFHVETPTVTTVGFVADDTATNGGVVGKVSYGTYVKTDTQFDELSKFLAILATKAGVKAQLDTNLEGKSTFAEIAEALTETFNFAPFVWTRVTGEKYEYVKDGEPKTGTKLKFSRYGTFATLEEGEGHLKLLDPTNVYDLKPAPTENTNSAVVTQADY